MIFRNGREGFVAKIMINQKIKLLKKEIQNNFQMVINFMGKNIFAINN